MLTETAKLIKIFVTSIKKHQNEDEPFAQHNSLNQPQAEAERLPHSMFDVGRSMLKITE